VITAPSIAGGSVAATPQNVAAGYSDGMEKALMAIAAVVLLLVVLVPPVIGQYLAGRKS
jgi:hypothetical protein